MILGNPHCAGMEALSFPSRTPAGLRLYVIGDIHGRADLLSMLLKQIENDAAGKSNALNELIFLGDYIDRGLDTKGVLDLLTGGLPHGMKATFLRGNHDDAMVRFLAGETDLAQGWLLLGGTATLASYGLNPFQSQATQDVVRLRESFAQKVPEKHVAFLRATLASCTRGDYYFVHAGIRPGVPLADQKASDKLWIRNVFLASHADHGKIIVHGHTVEESPVVRPNRIGIDTGAFATGKLTCLVLEGETRAFLQT